MMINIKCLFEDSIDIEKFYISIFDNNKLVCKGTTDKRGIFSFKGKRLNIYKVVCCYKGKKHVINYKTFICVNNCHDICLYFKKNINFSSPITILLTDKNYQGLPIEKGMVILDART